MTRLHVDEFGTGAPAVFVHGSFGWGMDTFPEQRVLADQYRIHLVDRVGYGQTPAADRAGWPVDVPALLELLAEVGGAHLVGQSYGAVVALTAAGQRPELIRSLVVIEPPLYRLAEDDPAVRPAAAAAAELATDAAAMDTAEYVREWGTRLMQWPPQRADQWTASWGPADWAAAATSRREALASDASIELAVLRGATWPKVVVRGAWPADRFPGREAAGGALRAVASRLADEIAARLVDFDSSAHNPQIEEPEAFNDLLRTTWRP